MQPWKVSVGLTTSITGAAVLLGGSRLRYLAPFWSVILDDYGLSIAVHLGLALVTVAAILYGAARAVGLADLGRRVNLVERSVRHGKGLRAWHPLGVDGEEPMITEVETGGEGNSRWSSAAQKIIDIEEVTFDVTVGIIAALHASSGSC